MAIHPTPKQIAAATKIVVNPELYAEPSTMRSVAWEILMAARGKRVNPFRLSQQQRAAVQQ